MVLVNSWYISAEVFILKLLFVSSEQRGQMCVCGRLTVYRKTSIYYTTNVQISSRRKASEWESGPFSSATTSTA